MRRALRFARIRRGQITRHVTQCVRQTRRTSTCETTSWGSLFLRGSLSFTDVELEEQLADSLTKTLSKATFRYHRSFVMNCWCVLEIGFMLVLEWRIDLWDASPRLMPFLPDNGFRESDMFSAQHEAVVVLHDNWKDFVWSFDFIFENFDTCLVWLRATALWVKYFACYRYVSCASFSNPNHVNTLTFTILRR